MSKEKNFSPCSFIIQFVFKVSDCKREKEADNQVKKSDGQPDFNSNVGGSHNLHSLES